MAIIGNIPYFQTNPYIYIYPTVFSFSYTKCHSPVTAVQGGGWILGGRDGERKNGSTDWLEMFTRPGEHTKSEMENGPVEIVDFPSYNMVDFSIVM